MLWLRSSEKRARQMHGRVWRKLRRGEKRRKKEFDEQEKGLQRFFKDGVNGATVCTCHTMLQPDQEARPKCKSAVPVSR